VLFISQPAVENRGPCMEILPVLPWDKTFRLFEKKLEATNSNPQRKGTVATPKSCHSKEQYCTAHNIYSCNKFALHKCNIYPSLPNLHDIDGPNLAASAMDHITHFVQLAKSVNVTHTALCNSVRLPIRCKIYWHFCTVEVSLFSVLIIRVNFR
jgi:hypothetical protein